MSCKLLLVNWKMRLLLFRFLCYCAELYNVSLEPKWGYKCDGTLVQTSWSDFSEAFNLACLFKAKR